MKIKKSLLSLATASTVALAGMPAAMAQETPADAPASQSSQGTALSSKDDGKTQESIDGSFGWNKDTTGMQKFQSIIDIIAKIIKTILGLIPGLGSSM